MSDAFSAIGKNVSRLRSERGISQARLAREACCGQTTLNLLENGNRDGLQVRTLVAIAVVLAKYKPLTLDEIVGFDGSRYFAPQIATRAEVEKIAEEVRRLRDELLCKLSS